MATAKRDYYEILGITRGASEDDIRKSYRRLAFQYHPDSHSGNGDAGRFKEIQEAYEVLADGERRSTYDRFGHVGANGGIGSPYGRSGGIGIEDIFDTFFGGGVSSQRQRVQRGADLRVDLKLKFEEAVFGIEREISFPKHDTCERCSGKGVEPGSEPITCVRCGGGGEIRRVHQNLFGQFVNVSICDRCNGHGTVITDPCGECRGQGTVRVTRKLKVNIPAGIDDDSQIRLTGEGDPSPNSGPAGNLYLVIHVEPHRYLRRQGYDLMLDLPVNIAQVALGDEIEVPTL